MNRTQAGIYYRIVILLLGLIQTLDVCADDPAGQSATALLTEMSQAVKNRDYRGTVVYLRDKKAETMRVFHARKQGTEKERVVALNSPMREVIRSDNEVTCYLPDARLVYVSRYRAHRSFLVQVPENLDKNAPFYDYLLAGREYVIQKESQVIELKPKDEFRYGRRIWVDLDTKLPLKFELFNENAELVEQMMFTDLEVVDSMPDESLVVSANLDTAEWEVRDGESLTDVNPAWSFNGVPEGFQQVFYRRSIMPTDKQAVEHILFSDGFSTVSVYVDEPGKDNVSSYQKQWGSIHSYSRLLDGYQVTVLGAVPSKTVQAIGDGISYLKASAR